MKHIVGVDRRLVERAEKGEEAVIVDGATDSGLPVLVVVVTGANVGLFKQFCGEVLPDLYRRYLAERKG